MWVWNCPHIYQYLIRINSSLFLNQITFNDIYSLVCSPQKMYINRYHFQSLFKAISINKARVDQNLCRKGMARNKTFRRLVFSVYVRRRPIFALLQMRSLAQPRPHHRSRTAAGAAAAGATAAIYIHTLIHNGICKIGSIFVCNVNIQHGTIKVRSWISHGRRCVGWWC